MRKLSIIMVVAMLLTTFAAMFVTPAAAAADASAPATVTDISGTNGDDYKLYTYATDAEAVEAGAIGRFTKEGGNGYALTWTAVGGNATSCGADVLYVLKDISTSSSAERITFDLGGSGRKLYIDGSLGQARTGESAGKNFTFSTTERLFHNGGNEARQCTAATLVWQNINLVATGTNSIIQSNYGLTIVFGSGCVLTHTGNSVNCIVIGNTSKVVVEEGAVITGPSAFTSGSSTAKPMVFTPNGAGAQVEINGGTITGCRIMQNNAGSIYVTVNGGTITYTDFYGIDCKKGGEIITVNGGKFIGTGEDNTYGTIMMEGAEGGTKVTINGGEFDNSASAKTSTAVVYAHTKGHKVVLNDGDGTKSLYAVYAAQAVDVTVNGGDWTGFRAKGAVAEEATTITINDGTFTTFGGMLLNVSSAAGPKTITINGGTFIAKDYTEELAVNYTTTYEPVGGYMYIAAGNTYINGGNFYSYAGEELATAGFHIHAWAGGNGLVLRGGNFYGGAQAINWTSAVDNGTGNVAGGYADLVKSAAPGEYTLATEEGASIRTKKDDTGIRFQSVISADMVAFLESTKGENEVQYGTLIIPADYLEATNGVFTKAALETAGKAYQEVFANVGLHEDGNGGYIVRAALVDIQEGNKTRDFVAIGFAKVGEAYIYAAEASAERSVDYVAKAALADVKATADGEYTTPVTSYYVFNEGTFAYTEADAYSKYSVDALTNIKGCLAN